MLLVSAFLLFEILYKAKLVKVNDGFFDAKNSLAMRGFWCLIVILVHVPAAYTNRIQDMIGSFAYIGVTFFFMTSSYGLTLSHDKDPDKIKKFWRKRLPKLLVVSLLINLSFAILNMIVFGDAITLKNLFTINGWVIWLIACYFAFWLSHLIFKQSYSAKILTVLLVIIGSIIMYTLNRNGIYKSTIWATECFGFIWGILLASKRDVFTVFFLKKWQIKLLISCCIAGILGVSYLRFKPIPIAGDYLLKIILGLAITLFVLVFNTRVALGNRINYFLGKISFEIYLVHLGVFHLFSRFDFWNSSSVFIISGMVATMIIAYLLNNVSGMILKQVNKVLV